MSIALDGAQLTLGLLLSKAAGSNEYDIVEDDSLFGTSMLWWERERTLLTVPDFTFGFTLALSEPHVHPDDLHSSLVYQYMRQLKLQLKAREFEASPSADHLYHLNRRKVCITDADARKDWPVGCIETLLGKACLADTRAIYAERSHATKRAFGGGGEDDDDMNLDEPLHRLFDFAQWPANSFESKDAFKSVFTVTCRNHVVAATVIAALLPFAPHVSSPSDPALDNKGCGSIFLLAGNRRAKGYLVRAKNEKLCVISRGEVAENTAVTEVVKQLGLKEPLRQASVRPIDPAAPAPYFGDANAALLVPAATPSFHPIFSRAGPKPRADLLVSVRVQPMPGEQSLENERFRSTVLLRGDFTYLGELRHDAIVEYKYGLQASRPPVVPALHTGGLATPPEIRRVSKRLRALDDDSDGLSRKKRICLLRDTLPYQAFRKTLCQLSRVWEFVPLIVGEDHSAADFVEVLSMQKHFEGLSPAAVFMCRDIALKLKLHRPTSSVMQRFDEFLARHEKEDFPRATWRLWWEEV
jgi:hypothetical protein